MFEQAPPPHQEHPAHLQLIPVAAKDIQQDISHIRHPTTTPIPEDSKADKSDVRAKICRNLLQIKMTTLTFG